MAKATFGAGKFRGKVGGFVYRNDAGVGNVVSEYNPHPSNPRTLAQTQQRSKMNFAGQYSKLINKNLIAGLDKNGRKARSKFVSNLLKSLENTTAGNVVTTQLRTSAVKFSQGQIVAINATAAYINDSQSNRKYINVTLTQLSDAINVAGGMIIVVGSTDGADQSVVNFVTSKNVSALSVNTPQSVEVNVPEAMVTAEAQAAVYFVPIVAENTQASVAFQNYLETIEVNFINSTAVRTENSGLNYAESVYITTLGVE